MASNIPHLVGMRVDAMRHNGPICEVLIAFAFVSSIQHFLER